MTSLELNAYTYKAKERVERKLCDFSRPVPPSLCSQFSINGSSKPKAESKSTLNISLFLGMNCYIQDIKPSILLGIYGDSHRIQT